MTGGGGGAAAGQVHGHYHPPGHDHAHYHPPGKNMPTEYDVEQYHGGLMVQAGPKPPPNKKEVVTKEVIKIKGRQ